MIHTGSPNEGGKLRKCQVPPAASISTFLQRQRSSTRSLGSTLLLWDILVDSPTSPIDTFLFSYIYSFQRFKLKVLKSNTSIYRIVIFEVFTRRVNLGSSCWMYSTPISKDPELVFSLKFIHNFASWPNSTWQNHGFPLLEGSSFFPNRAGSWHGGVRMEGQKKCPTMTSHHQRILFRKQISSIYPWIISKVPQ